jgi:hypothetical protein
VHSTEYIGIRRILGSWPATPSRKFFFAAPKLLVVRQPAADFPQFRVPQPVIPAVPGKTRAYQARLPQDGQVIVHGLPRGWEKFCQPREWLLSLRDQFNQAATRRFTEDEK